MFTIIDDIFVGNGVGTDALGAVNLAMPFVMMVNALFMLTSIGGVTVAAVRIGRDDTEGANSAFMHSVTGTLAIAAVLTIVGTLLTEQLCSVLGAGGGTFRWMVFDYTLWYSVFIIPAGFSVALQGFCRNDGNPILVSVSVVIGTCLNIILDWLFVFQLQMGIKGAAIATGISETVSLIIILFHFILKKGQMRFKRFKVKYSLLGKIALRGLPEAIAKFGTPISTLCMNYVLLERFNDIAVNAYSIICYVASFSVVVFFGTSEGLQPLFGQSYGAKNDGDLKYYFRAGIIINFVGSLIIVVLLLFIGETVCALFGADGETLAFTVAHMPQYSWGFVVASLNVIISAYMYSTKRTKEAMIINVLRSFVINSIVTVLLPAAFGNSIVWFTFGIYEILVLVVTVALLRKSEKNGIVYR